MLPEYTVISILGKGAGSTLHKVRHRLTGKVYALKQVLRDNDPEGLFFSQVRTEYEVGRQIAHPGVRQVFELHRVRRLVRVSQLCLMLEYLEGQTLEQARVTDPTKLVRIFKEVAAALQAVHQAGFVHADIKPNNIMICSDGVVKIFDLGQSCKLGSTKRRIQGTPDFIAPEQVMKLPVDERTDVFNLGATMYWCLTGKPFPTRLKSQQRADSFDVGSVRHAETPQELRPDVPAVWSALVMDCCRNGPASRPAMGEVLQRIASVEHASRIMKK